MTPIDWDALIPGCSHFRWFEAVRTEHADLIAANRDYLESSSFRRESVQRMAVEVLEPIRSLVRRPVLITSWIRCPELNAAVRGSSSTSEHMAREPGQCAVDLQVHGFPIDMVFAIVRSAPVAPPAVPTFRWGQLILEPRGAGPNSWLHISLETSAHHMEVLT